MTNLDAITDDIRQVMEVQRNQPEGTGQQIDERGRAMTYWGGRVCSRFDLGAEIAKETKRVLSEPAADARELSRYHDETMRLIAKYGMDAVAKVIVQCRNQALREGKL